MQQSQSWEANSSLASEEILPTSRSPAHNSCANAGRRDEANSWSCSVSYLYCNANVIRPTKRYTQLPELTVHLRTLHQNHIFINSTRKWRQFVPSVTIQTVTMIGEFITVLCLTEIRETFILSKGNILNWPQTTKCPAHISSRRPTVFNTEFRLFSQSLQKYLLTINR